MDPCPNPGLRARRGRAGALVLLAAGLATSPWACTSARVQLHEDALAAWRSGDRGRGLVLASHAYGRFLSAEGVAAPVVRARAYAAAQLLDTDPVVAPGEVLWPSPEGRRGLMDNPHGVAEGIRADLLGGQATAVMRAALVVGRLGLVDHAPGLLFVIFDPGLVQRDGAFLAGDDGVMTALVAKRLALDALDALSTP